MAQRRTNFGCSTCTPPLEGVLEGCLVSCTTHIVVLPATNQITHCSSQNTSAIWGQTCQRQETHCLGC